MHVWNQKPIVIWSHIVELFYAFMPFCQHILSISSIMGTVPEYKIYYKYTFISLILYCTFLSTKYFINVLLKWIGNHFYSLHCIIMNYWQYKTELHVTELPLNDLIHFKTVLNDFFKQVNRNRFFILCVLYMYI